VSGLVTLGDVAHYLAASEAQVTANRLEIARPARPEQRVDELALQGGDRLLIFSAPPNPVELPSPALGGGLSVRFSSGGTSLSSAGKRSLVVGKSEAGFLPDVDLRLFIAPRALEAIAPDCLRLYFNDAEQTWYMNRSGNTRVMVDELELEARPVILNEQQRVRFYRAGEGRPLGEIAITLEKQMTAPNDLTPGNLTAIMSIGLENENHSLRASGNIRVEQMMSGLAQYHRLKAAPQNLRLYVARLGAPHTTLEALTGDELLYSALSLPYRQQTLSLRDFHHPEHVYILLPGRETLLIGCRAERAATQPDLDTDLYESVVGAGGDPRPFQGISPYLAQAEYRAAEGGWWLRLDERAQVPVFLNNSRLSRQMPTPITAGDVVSIGPSLTHYYARLEAEHEG
jgi:hypothetical protein